jgi:hypothetical protein
MFLILKDPEPGILNILTIDPAGPGKSAPLWRAPSRVLHYVP